MGEHVTKKIAIIILFIGLLMIFSCDNNSTGNDDKTELEGIWVGYELEGNQDVWTIEVTDNILDIIIKLG